MMRLLGVRPARDKADPIKTELKNLLGEEFPHQRTKATQFVLTVKEALDRYIFSEALRQSENDLYSVQQHKRVEESAQQLLEFLQPHDSIEPYTWENENGVLVKRPALNPLPRILDLIGRAAQRGAPSISIATVHENLQWLIDTSSLCRRTVQTDWAGVCKAKRKRGRPAGRRRAQVLLAVDLASALSKVGVLPKLDKEHWKGSSGAYAQLVAWALKRVATRTKKRRKQQADWANIAKRGLQEWNSYKSTKD